MKEDGIEKDSQASGLVAMCIHAAEISKPRTGNCSLSSREGRLSRPGERFFNQLEQKNLRPGNVVFLLPVKEDGIEEDYKASSLVAGNEAHHGQDYLNTQNIT